MLTALVSAVLAAAPAPAPPPDLPVAVYREEQARVYRAVYQAQEDILAAIKPGVTMGDLQEVAEASLKRAGYLLEDVEEWVASARR
jgi:hypothetical protein